MVYAPPSAAGIDAWARLGNPEWTWESLIPYLQKAVDVTLPGQDFDIKNPPTNAPGPIKVSYPALGEEPSHPLIEAWHEAFETQGYQRQVGFTADGKAVGTRDIAATIDPITGLRSSSNTGYGLVAASRPNVMIMTEATAQRIIFDSYSACPAATGVEYTQHGRRHVVKATKEVILSAGAIHTPKILEHSGIGHKSRLKKLGIPVILHQPGVGENFQTHLRSVHPFPLKPRTDLEGLKCGLKTLALTQLDPEDLSQLFLDQGHEKSTSARIVESIFQTPDNASASFAMAVIGSNPNVAIVAATSTFPFSRGSIHITSANPEDSPMIDAGLANDPLDLEILARHLHDFYKLIPTSPLKEFFEFNGVQPDLDTLKDQIRATGDTSHHACGTAAMMAQEEGGVVDQNLSVYGIENLRIVDASIFPLIPDSSPISLVYAVAERAADIILGK